MSCNKWVPSKLTKNASKVPTNYRMEFLVSNALQPIPEHKLDVIYFYLFNQPFKPSLFGRFSTITEVVASIPNLYRTISNDGRAYIHYKKAEPGSNISSRFKHKEPKWAVVESKKSRLFGSTSIFFRIEKEGVFVRDIDLGGTLCAELNRSFIVFGRDPSSDFCVQHPSISRHHSLVQFANDGTLFLYDLSTHGTTLNGSSIPKRKYVELKHNDSIQFGHSSRSYLLRIEKEGKSKKREKDDVVGVEKENAKNAMNLQYDEMRQTIAKLTKDLDSAKKKVATKSSEVMSLRQQMESLKVNHHQREERKEREKEKVSNTTSGSDSDSEYDGSEDVDSAGGDDNDSDSPEEEEEEEDISESEEREKRVSKIKGIDFVKQRHHLAKLTVVKLKHYTEANGIDVGKVRKAELVRIIGKDIDRHFG